jgi:hypothetical protein
MKKLTIEGFHAMTSKEKTELVKNHLGLDVGDGWKICGHSDRRIIVGRDIPTLCFHNGWTYIDTTDVILSKHKYHLYATPAAISAINKKNSTSKTD